MSGRWLISLGLLGGALAGALVWLGWRWVTPRRYFAPDPPGERAETVWFRSLDGTRLHGLWLLGREDYPTIVLCHGYNRSLAEPLDIGAVLNQAGGYNVFLFDFRACGRSGGRFTTVGRCEAWDVQAAVSLVGERYGRGPVGVFGISMGGAAAIMAAAHTPEIAAVVADSAFARLEAVMRKKVPEYSGGPGLASLGWLCVLIGEAMAGGGLRRVSPVEHVGRISPRPILFIYGERDSYIPAEQSLELYEAAGEPKEIWAVPGSDHAVARLDYPDKYKERVISFFDRHLRGVEIPQRRQEQEA